MSNENDAVAHDVGVAAARARVQINRELEREEVADRAVAEAALRQAVPEADFEQGRRMLAKYLAGLPADKRAQIENETLPGGTRALNDPVTVLKLAGEALGELPTDPKAMDAELEASRKRMREDPRGWYADDRAQIRYRRMLRAMDESNRGGN